MVSCTGGWGGSQECLFLLLFCFNLKTSFLCFKKIRFILSFLEVFQPSPFSLPCQPQKTTFFYTELEKEKEAGLEQDFFLFKPLFYKQVANSLNCLSIQLQKVKIYIYIFKYWEYGIQQRGYFHTQVMLPTTPFSLESSSTLKFYCILYIYIYKRFYCKIMNKMFCLYLCVSTAK